MSVKPGLSYEERVGLKMCVNKESRTIFEPRREKVGQSGEDCIIKVFITCTLHRMLEWSSQGG
jgi:hypothetical protein